MEVTLLFPPATDVRSPHLAIPSLAAHLGANGIGVNARDLNLEGLFACLDPSVLSEAAARCRRQLAGASGERLQRLRRGLDRADYVVEHAAGAVADLRDPIAFHDPHRYHLARSCILAALELVSAAHGRVTYTISNAVYRVEGVDQSRLADLASVSADPDANLFGALYQDSVVAELDRSPPAVVGICVLNGQQIIPGLTLARLLKDRGHFVVIGGTVYAKFVPELMARPQFFELFCDGLFPYEGETAMLALLEQLDGPRQFGAVPNYIHLDGHGQPVMGPTHVEDVNSFPPPDFGCLPLDQYLSPVPVLPILTGKGCYFNRCKFCDIPFINSISSKAYRQRAPELVAADVATLQARHGARHFEITDETLSPRLLLRLADALDDHPSVDARFAGYARLEPGFTPEACGRIYDMGMRKLFFGLESGSQATLDHMRKGIRVETARAVLRNCADAGIGFHVFSIIGFPEEQETSARGTLGFLLDNAEVIEHPRNSFDIHPFGLDLRTEYGDQPGSFGIEIDADHLASRDFPISVKHWTNTRGLDQSDVERLLAEFDAILRLRFRGYRNYPDSLWPGFEEYAVLYGDHYDRRPFGWRFSLPPAGDPLRFSTTWADDVRVDDVRAEGDEHQRWVVTTLTGTTTVGASALAVLAPARSAVTVDELLETMASQFAHDLGQRAALRDELRAGVDQLLAIRALWLVPVHEEELRAEVAAPSHAVGGH